MAARYFTVRTVIETRVRSTSINKAEARARDIIERQGFTPVECRATEEEPSGNASAPRRQR